MNFPFLKKNKTGPKSRGQISLARRPARPNLSELTRKSASPYLSPLTGAHLGPFSPESVPLSVKKRMRRDPQIRLGLNIIKAPILALDFWVEGDDGEISAFVEAALRPIWRSLLRSSLNAVDFGFQAHEKVWKLGGLVVDGPGGQRRYSDVFLYKKIKDLDPAEVALLADERGDYAGFRQGEIEVAAEKTFVMTAGREWGNLYGRSRLDFAYESWYWAAIMYMFCNRYFERKGDPPILGRAPAEERLDKDGATINTLDEAATVISNLKAGGTAVFPDERDEAGNLRWDFQYLLDDKRADQFLRYIEHLAVMKLRALLVPERVLTQDTSTGSYAMARAHTETFLLSEEILLQESLDHINKYLVPQLVEYNFGPDSGSFQVRTSGLSRTNLEILKDVLLRLFDDDGAGPGQRLRDIIDISKVLEELDIPKKMQEKGAAALTNHPARLNSTDTGADSALKEQLFEHPEIEDILEEQRLALFQDTDALLRKEEPLKGLDSLRVKFVGKLENALKKIMLEQGQPADKAKDAAAKLARDKAEQILDKATETIREGIKNGQERTPILGSLKKALSLSGKTKDNA